MDNAYFKPPIIIESHDLLASDIRRAMNEIATMERTNFLPFLDSYKLNIFWLFFGLPFRVAPVMVPTMDLLLDFCLWLLCV